MNTIAPARERSFVGNPVLAVLMGVMLLAVLVFGFVTVAPNRILSGRPVSLWVAVDGRILAAVILEMAVLAVATLMRPSRGLQWLVAGAAGALVVTVVLAAGSAARQGMLEAGSPAARVSLGASFWVLALAAALAAADALERLRASVALRFGLALFVMLAIALAARAGLLDDLSLAREFANRQETFTAELARHMVLVLAALGPALIIGTMLGALALHRPARAGAIFAALNVTQTIPSIALFGLLIEPLTGLSQAVPALRDLGLRGIGPAPAIIALTVYGLLPVARGVQAGFAGVPASVLEAARGMGMSGPQILRDVSFPLALPVLVSGFRIVTIQLIGLAVVAALIGAGGLGTFVFQGLGQTATDLVLLGALSAVGLALFVDGALRSVAGLVDRRVPR